MLSLVASGPGAFLGCWWLLQEVSRRKDEEANNREYFEAQTKYRAAVARERRSREEKAASDRDRYNAAIRGYRKEVEAEQQAWERSVVEEERKARAAHEAEVRRWEQTLQPLRAEAERRRQAHRGAEWAFTEAEKEWQAAADRIVRSFDDKKASLEGARSSHQALDGEYQRQRLHLQNRAKELQLQDFLDKQLIEDAKIEQIAEGLKTILRSFGIETALDIEENAILNIKGFGPARTEKLLAWRRLKEQAFAFDPVRGVPLHELQGLEQKYRPRRNQLEADLRAGSQHLQGIVTMGSSELQSLRVQVESRARELGQAQADLREIPKGL
jgi:DNA-binding helix-hairpin-helix protein with protein kinase domain